MKQNKSGKGLFHFLIAILFSLAIQCTTHNTIDLKQKSGTIEGNIKSYDGKIKSGKLVYFDAISRIIQNEIFAIDSMGKFKVSFKIPHPILNIASLNFQGNYYPLFLEPGKNLKINIDGKSIKFLGESGLSNNQVMLLRDTIYKKFGKEIDRCNWLHTKNVTFQYYMQEQSKLAKMKLEFI